MGGRAHIDLAPSQGVGITPACPVIESASSAAAASIISRVYQARNGSRSRRPSGRRRTTLLAGTLAGREVRVSAPARPRPSHPAERAEPPRQHLGDEEAGGGLDPQRQRRRLAAGANTGRCDIVLPDQFVDRTKRRWRAHVFRARHRGAHRVCRPGVRRNCGELLFKAARGLRARASTTAALT